MTVAYLVSQKNMHNQKLFLTLYISFVFANCQISVARSGLVFLQTMDFFEFSLG